MLVRQPEQYLVTPWPTKL